MKWKEPPPAQAVLLLSMVTLACLVPFINKAVHIDDPLFIWTARQINSHPLDFYGFPVDWGRNGLHMAVVMQNPPLAGYWLAATASLLGWSEPALHFGFLFPALALVLGSYFLASRFCSHPFVAALATAATPVFLLSATSLMCDTLMVALWVWALYFWVEGFRRDKPALLAAGAGLAGMGCLAKYFGVCLILLMFVYALGQKRRLGSWLACLSLPLLMLGGYEWFTHSLYGSSLLLNAAYFVQNRVGGALPSKLVSGFSFTGGCIFIAITALPLVWGKKGLAAAIAGAIAMVVLIVAMGKVGEFIAVEKGHIKWSSVIQIAIFACGGIAVLVLAAQDLLRRRGADSVMLFLWVVGTLVFVIAVNWTVSGRNILPMAPAVCLLLVRRLESDAPADLPDRMGRLFGPIGISLAVALAVGWGDWKLADAGRKVAYAIGNEYKGRFRLGFEGHWGFQYYFEQFGAKAVDRDLPDLSFNERIVVPMNNAHLFELTKEKAALTDEYFAPGAGWLSLMCRPMGSGYYSDAWGPAPFMFGPSPDERYLLFRAK